MDRHQNESEVALITINVADVNDRPVAESFTIDANNEQTVSINLQQHIFDEETAASNLNINFVPVLSSVLGGSIEETGANLFSYTVNDPETNEDYVVYRVSDEDMTSFAEVITISNLNNNKSQNMVEAANSILTVNDEAWVKYGQSIDLEFLGIDKTYPFEQLQISVTQQPEFGSLSNFVQNTYTGSVLTTYKGKYAPTVNKTGTDSIVFSVSNGTETVEGILHIHVSAVKVAPQLSPLTVQTINENDTLFISLPVTDKDNSLSDLSWNIDALPDIALSYEVQLVDNVPVAQIVPPLNFAGNVMLNVTVSDPDNLSDSEMFSLKVVNKNNAPVAHFETTLTAYEDSSFSYILKAEDYDKDSLSFMLSGLPEWLDSKKISKYAVEIYGTPTNDNVGNTQFTVEVSDQTDSIMETVFVEIINTNDLPYALAAFDTIKGNPGDEAVFIDLINYFADDDAGAVFTFSIAENSNENVAQASLNQSNLQINFDGEELGTSVLTINAISQGDTVSATVIILVDNKVGIHSVDEGYSFAVYPNPVSDNFTVLFDAGSKEWQLQITDLSGRLIYFTELNNQREVNLSANIFHASGTYVIRAISEQIIKTQKIIVH